MAKRKKGMTFIPYDYEAAYNKSLEDMNEFFVEQMFKHGNPDRAELFCMGCRSTGNHNV